MSNYNKVIWSEGMFLRHEHFQQQERYIDNALKLNLQHLHNEGWGYTQLEIEKALLLMGKLKLTRCSGVFPDATVFQDEVNCYLPEAIDIPHDTNDCIVYLAIPLRGSDQVELDRSENPVHLARYHTEMIDVRDSNTQAMEATTLCTAHLKLRLLLETQDCSQFACIAVARVKEVTVNNEVILDENFIAPSLSIKVNAPIFKFVEHLHALISNRCEDLAAKLNRPERYEASHMSDFLLLQLLSGYRILSQHWKSSHYLHPERLYSELLKLAGELSSFTEQHEVLASLPIYQHEALEMCYMPLMDMIIDALKHILNHRAIQLPLENQQPNLYTATVIDWSGIAEHEFVVAINADMEPEQLQQLFNHQIKIASLDNIQDLINSQLPGISSSLLPVAPSQIPYHAGFSYFHINRHDPLFALLNQSSGIAIHIGRDIPGLKVELWHIKQL